MFHPRQLTHGAQLLLPVLLAGGWIASFAAAATAHPINLTRATLTFSADRTYQLDITCELPAYVMQVQPGHIDDDLAEEFRSLPLTDLNGMLDDARASFGQRVAIQFDGQPSAP